MTTFHAFRRMPPQFHAAMAALHARGERMQRDYLMTRGIVTVEQLRAARLDKVDWSVEAPEAFAEIAALRQAVRTFNHTDCMGVVTDATFIFCYWPKADTPVALMAPGSSGIRVMGNTPRNIVFPAGTVFLPYKPDALYPAELAVKAAGVQSMINLTPAMTRVWRDAYQAAVDALPVTAATHQTRGDCMFERVGEEVTEISMARARQIADAKRV